MPGSNDDDEFAFDWTALTASNNAYLRSVEKKDHGTGGDLLTNAEAFLFKYYQMRQQRNEEAFQTKAREKKFLALLSLSLQNANDSSSNADNTDVVTAVTKAVSQEQDDFEEKKEYISGELHREFAAVKAKEVHVAKDKKLPSTVPAAMAANDKNITKVKEESSVNYNQSSSSASVASAATTAAAAVTAAVEPFKIAKRKIGELSATDVAIPAEVEDPHKVFSTPGLLLLQDWDPRKAEEALYLKLPAFGFEANQTLAFKVSVRSDFKRWSFNIAPADHQHYNNILFHFAPSYHKKRAEHQLVVNDKAGTWGSGLKDSFRINDPLTPSSRVMQIVVCIAPMGFFVFANDKFRIFFPHRRDVTSLKDLSFFVLNRDENGNPEESIIHSVWWGRTLHDDRSKLLPDMQLLTANMAEYQIPSVPFNQVSIVVRGLPVITDYHEIQYVEAALRDVFDEFGPVSINVVRGLSMAYVRLAEVAAVQAAIAELDGAAIQDSAGVEMVLALAPYSDA